MLVQIKMNRDALENVKKKYVKKKKNVRLQIINRNSIQVFFTGSRLINIFFKSVPLKSFFTPQSRAVSLQDLRCECRFPFLQATL